MAKCDELLSRLDKVSQKGGSSWVARCPAHADNNPSLSVKLDGDSLLIHCFAGCGAHDIVSAVGMTLADLMPETVKMGNGRKMPRFSKHEMFDVLMLESYVLALTFADLADGRPTDMERARLAYKKITRINELSNWG